MKYSKVLLAVIAVVFAVAAFFGYRYYQLYFANNVAKEGYVLIPHTATFASILDSIAPYVEDHEAFKKVAKDKNMDRVFKAGRYKINAGTGNTDLVNMIKAGNQTEDKFRIGDFYSVYQMVGRVAKKTEADSATFAKELNQIAVEKGFSDAEDLKRYFFIDTYHFFWTVSPAEFFKTFEKQYEDFWTPERLQKEKELGLSRAQVYALASLVYKETGGKPDEMKTVAGLYLNRHRKGMKLQSDPTVIYAVSKAENFKNPPLKRVFYKHLREPSPYNTYYSVGIPPGPICVVDQLSVEAVLNAENNNHIYMCADPTRPGYHKFTASAEEHAINAKEYQDWLNARNIR